MPNKYRTTHVIVDTVTNKLVGSGIRANCDARAGVLNSAAHSWRYHVKPIHR